MSALPPKADIHRRLPNVRSDVGFGFTLGFQQTVATTLSIANRMALVVHAVRLLGKGGTYVGNTH
jgi:hypothetical protein